MYKNKRSLAIIPARGGSKGLPGKNLREMNGKPMIAWTIEQANNSELLDRAIVTTDSEEIAEVAAKWGGDVPFIRPSHLAQDDSAMIGALEHALQSVDEEYDIILLLEPTSPLRNSHDIDRGIMLLVDNWDTHDSIVSLGEVQLENPEICKLVESERVVPYNKESRKITYRQQLEKVYFPYGVLYGSKTSTISKYEGFYQDRTLPMFIDRWQNYEVDDRCDFICIDAIMKDMEF